MQYIKTEGLLIDTVNKEFNVLNNAISLSSTTTKKEFNLFDKEGIALDVNNKKINVLTDVISLSGNTKQFNLFNGEGVNLDVNNKKINVFGTEGINLNVNNKNFNVLTSAISLSGNTKQFNVFGTEGINLDVNNKNFNVLTSAISLTGGNTKQFNVFGTEGIALDINNKNLSFLNGVISFSSDPNVNNFKAVDNGNVGKSCVGIVNNGNTTLDASFSITTTNSTVSSNSFSVNSKSSISKHDSISLLGDSNTLANSSINILGKNNILNTNSILFNSNNSTVSSRSVQINGDNNFVDNNSLSILGSSNFVTNSSTNIASNNNKIYNNSLNIDGFNNLVSSNSVALNSFDSNLRDTSLAINTFNSGLSTNSILINSRNTTSRLSSIDLLGSNNTLRDKSVSVNGQNNTILSNSLAFNTNNSSITGNSVVLGGNSNIVNDFSFVVASSGSKAYNESSVIGGKSNTASLSSVAIGSVNTEIIGQNSQSIGGSNNNFNASNSVFLGGQNNASANVPNGTSNGNNSFIIGGTNNKTGNNGIIIGGKDNLIQNNSIVIGGSGNNTGNFSSVLILGRNNIVANRSDVVYLPEIIAQGNLTITGNISAGGNITSVNTTTGNVSAFNVNNYLYDIVPLQVDQNKTPLVGTLDSARFNYFGQPRLYVNNQGVSINTSSSVLNQALTISGNVSASGNLKVDNTLLIGADANLYRSDTNTLKTDDNFVVGNITVPISLAAATTDAVVINNSNTLAQRSIDSRVWGTTLVDGNGNGTINSVPKWTDSNTVSNSQIWDNVNVGINTSLPNEKLTVSGSISASGALYGVATLINNSNGIGYIEIGGSSGAYIDLKSPNSDDFDLRMITDGSTNTIQTGAGQNVVFATTNVGIATTSPNERLTVSGNISATGNLTVNGDVVLGSDALDTLTFNGGPVNFPNATSVADAIVLGGDVTLYRNGANSLRTNDDFVADGSIFTNSNFVIITNTDFPQYILRSNANNNNRWGMWLQTPSTPTTGNPLIIGPQDTSGGGIGLLTLTRTSSSTNAVGNVGINTSTPNEKLTVFGNISASGNIYSTGAYRAVQGVPSTGDSSTNGYAFGADGDTGLFSPIIGAGGGANGALALYTNGALALSTTNVNTYFNTNVGIGTTVNPAEKLTVNGNIGALGDVRISSAVSGGEGKSLTIINNVDNILNTSVALYLQPNNASGNARAAAIKAFQSPTAGNNTDLRFYTSNFDLPAERMIITSNGNVGIGTAGTTTPGGKLHIHGGPTNNTEAELYITGSNGYIQIHNSSSALAWNPMVSEGDKSIIFSSGTTDGTAGLLIGPHSSFNKGIKIQSSGDITIGTIAAGTTNSVIIESSGTLQKRTIDSRVWGTSLVDGSGTANYVAKWTTGGKTITNSIIFDNGTNVGIGTDSPGVKLDVNGVIRSNNEIIGNGLPGSGQARYINGNYGVIHRNDGGEYYILKTASGDQYGVWDDKRPFFINLSTGRVAMIENVGIGQAPSATEKLIVAGNVNVSENISGVKNVVMGTQANKATLTYTTNTARTYTIPDAGANADFVMNAGNQTIAGTKTFSGNTTFPNGAQATPSINFTGSTNTGFYFATNQVSTSIAGTERFRVTNNFVYTPKLLVNTISTSTEVFKVEGDSRLKDTYINSNGQEFLISNNYGVGSLGRNIYIGNGGQFTAGTSSNFGSYNTSLGVDALSAITTGRYNTAVGSYSQQKTTSGQYNTSLGLNCSRDNITGQQNTAVGYDALRLNLSDYNTAIGSNAMDALNSPFANNNTAVGCNAFEKTPYGYENTAIGANSMREGTSNTGSVYGNTAVGYNSLFKCAGYDNTGIGTNAGGSITTGFGNSLLGAGSGPSITTGSANICLGNFSGYNITAGYYNVCIGSNMNGITTGTNNIAIGESSLNGGANISNCVAVGVETLQFNRASNNVAVGYQAGKYSGFDSGVNPVGLTYIGYLAGTNNTTGQQNTAVGDRSSYLNTAGGNNTAIGRYAHYNNDSGNSCVAIGVNALYEALGSDNIGIGANAGRLTGAGGAALTTGTGNILIGSYSRPSAAAGTNQIVIGNSIAGKANNTAFIGGTSGAYNGNNTTTWVTTSDKRIKKNIRDNSEGLNKIKSIKVKNFEYKKLSEIEEIAKSSFVDKEGVQLGVIAQEFKEILPDCVSENESGILSVNTDSLVWYLINAVKELTERLEKLESKIK
jgi:hypothetical protein